jgi:hypothetical protein
LELQEQLTDGSSHVLRVDYEPLTVADSDGASDAGSSTSSRVVGFGNRHQHRVVYGFRIFVDDPDARRPPVLEIPLKLTEILQPNNSGGRAWVGLSSSVRSDSQGYITLTKWSFEGSAGDAAAGASADLAKESAIRDAWRGLELEYLAEGPQKLVLTQGVLCQYNRLFSFLFIVKRAGAALEVC